MKHLLVLLTSIILLSCNKLSPSEPSLAVKALEDVSVLEDWSGFMHYSQDENGDWVLDEEGYSWYRNDLIYQVAFENASEEEVEKYHKYTFLITTNSLVKGRSYPWQPEGNEWNTLRAEMAPIAAEEIGFGEKKWTKEIIGRNGDVILFAVQFLLDNGGRKWIVLSYEKNSYGEFEIFRRVPQRELKGCDLEFSIEEDRFFCTD
jgi:hypothetical protein